MISWTAASACNRGRIFCISSEENAGQIPTRKNIAAPNQTAALVVPVNLSKKDTGGK
jgi:hypothetical protein